MYVVNEVGDPAGVAVRHRIDRGQSHVSFHAIQITGCRARHGHILHTPPPYPCLSQRLRMRVTHKEITVWDEDRAY